MPRLYLHSANNVYAVQFYKQKLDELAATQEQFVTVHVSIRTNI